ncbi:MAG: YHS domain protein [Flavobacterium sp.]|nr:YHS domain protein [Flavobacterium sp.]
MRKIVFLLAVFTSLLCEAQPQINRLAQFNLTEKLALQGYDPVAYFKGKAKMGKETLAVSYMGVTYYFSSAANKATFSQNATAYEPQYGGWCAYAMGTKGEKVPVDPETFKIVNGKLYLFYNALFNNTLKAWNKDEVGLKQAADQNWSKIQKLN